PERLQPPHPPVRRGGASRAVSADHAHPPYLYWPTAMNLSQWLDRIEQLHPKSVDMGLERIGAVAARLGIDRPARRVITVAGTNGKGSTVAFIEAIARAAGDREGVVYGRREAAVVGSC